MSRKINTISERCHGIVSEHQKKTRAVGSMIDKRTRATDIRRILKKHYPKPKGQVIEEYTYQDQKAIEDAYDTATKRASGR